MNAILTQLQRNYYEIIKIALFILAIALTVWISPKESIFRYEFQQGKPWSHSDLFAPFDFSIVKTEEELANEREQILRNFAPYFKLYEEITAKGRRDLEQSFADNWIITYNEDRRDDSLRFLNQLRNIYDGIEDKGIIRYNEVLEGKTKSSPIRFIRGNEVTEVTLGSFYNIRTANDYALQQLEGYDYEDSIFMRNVISQALVQNVLYESNLSRAEIEQFLTRVSPTRGLIQKGELIISSGEVVTAEKYQQLSSLKKEYEQELGSSEARKIIVSGMVLLVSLLFILQFLYLFLYKKKFYDSLKYIILILMTQAILMIVTHYIFENFPQWTLMIPFAILPVIIVAFTDAGVAIVVHLVTVMVLGFYAPNSFSFFYTQFAAGIVAVFAVRQLNKRADLFRASMLVFLTYMVVYVSLMLVQDGSVEKFSTNQATYLAGSSILLLLAFPFIFLYEKLFGILTHLSLLELSNTNNPLLRDLSIKAPGTFQHSLQVANLASEALYEIGGDALLARTGALYHDIGKMENPLYFVENQVSGYNPHDELTYEESARIIIGHVLTGIEMARKNGLPEQIIDFIRTHHGNRRVEYFYRLERKLNPGMEVDQTEFSYHGPIPFSRETAVVMMADSVEAASRSISQSPWTG
ncbi:MAG: HDIG domain-containing protein [bacterium]